MRQHSLRAGSLNAILPSIL
jgi:hypothetical protein